MSRLGREKGQIYFSFLGGGKVLLVVRFREDGQQSPGRARLVASHQFLYAGMPDAAIEDEAEVPAGARSPVIDRAVYRMPDFAFEGGAPGMASVRAFHADPEPRHVVRQFRGNKPSALFIRLAPVEGDPEGGAARPAGQARIIGRGKILHS
jgi:hypothetical protein